MQRLRGTTSRCDNQYKTDHNTNHEVQLRARSASLRVGSGLGFRDGHVTVWSATEPPGGSPQDRSLRDVEDCRAG